MLCTEMESTLDRELVAPLPAGVAGKLGLGKGQVWLELLWEKQGFHISNVLGTSSQTG